jgi:hypothetical protein
MTLSMPALAPSAERYRLELLARGYTAHPAVNESLIPASERLPISPDRKRYHAVVTQLSRLSEILHARTDSVPTAVRDLCKGGGNHRGTSRTRRRPIARLDAADHDLLLELAGLYF